MEPLEPIVVIALLAYLAYSLWNAYSTGVYNGLLKAHRTKGVVSGAPYFSLATSFAGIMVVIFITYELIGYYTHFIRENLPAKLSSLDFFTFLYTQFLNIKLSYYFYIGFLAIGIAISACLSFLIVRFLYRMGHRKVNAPQQ